MKPLFTLHLGRDDEFSIQFSNPDGTPYDLEGCTVAVALKLTPDGAELLRIDASNGLEITEPASQGFVRFTVPPAAKVAAGLTDLTTYSADVLLLDEQGRAVPMDEIAGPVDVIATITQPAA